ncbi:hypothetical protein Efla_002010 [Eimeria flavescens]
MAGAASTNFSSMEALQDTSACEPPAPSQGRRSPDEGRRAAQCASSQVAGELNISEEPGCALQLNVDKPTCPNTLIPSLNNVYFGEVEEPAAEASTSHASDKGVEAPTGQSDYFACVQWELEQLPKNKELVANVVARLEELKAHEREISRSLCCRVAERREELTKAASVLGQLRKALEKLRNESAAVRSGLSQFRRDCLQPSLAITKQQQIKLTLQREMQRLLQIQRVEAILMAAEHSCVSRQLPLQAALLVEGAALSLCSEDTQAASEEDINLSVREGIKRMQQMLGNLKAELNAAIQAAVRSLPPPPCGCGWQQPDAGFYAPHRVFRRFRSGSGVAAATAGNFGDDTWPLYYSALAAFALLPPSSAVGSSIAAAVAAAAAAATRQVLCAFVPADAAAFSEAESECVEAQRISSGLLIHNAQQSYDAAAAAVVSADPVTTLPSAENLAASVAATDAAACFMTLLGIQYDFLVGAAALMRWHASEALRLLAEVKRRQEKGAGVPASEPDMLELLSERDFPRGNTDSTTPACVRSRSDSSGPHCETEFVGTCELAASATQRLAGLPSSLRMALFLLQVRKQFLSQRMTLWQQLQHQTAEVLQHLDLGGGGTTAVSDCLSLMQAVGVFANLGAAFVAAENPEVEARLAAEARAAAVTVAAAAASAPLSSQSVSASANAESAAGAAVAADAAAAAAGAVATAAGDADCGYHWAPSGTSTSRLAQVLVARVQEAIDTLQEKHAQDLLQQVKAETWERLPVLRRFPLVLLRSPRRLNALTQEHPEILIPFAVDADSCSVPTDAGGIRSVCTVCGDTPRTCTVPNPFARWQPGTIFPGEHGKSSPYDKGGTAAVELAAIEEELRAAEACGRPTDEPPVVVAASQAAAKFIMQYWQLAVCSPEVAVTAVKAMLKLAGFYIAAVAASTLPEDICSCLAAPPKQGFPSFGDMSGRPRTTASADAAMLRSRLPHLHWLLCQAGQDLRATHAKLLRSRSGDVGNGTSRAERPVFAELIRPMARLASPGALWGLAERVAAVESARDLLQALAQQLQLQGLPQHFGNGEETWEPHQPTQALAGTSSSSRLLHGLAPEDQQQLWRLLAATRCGAEDLRGLVYRVAAASLCQSSAFLAAFQQAGADCSSDRASATPGPPRDGGRGSPAATSGSYAVPQVYCAAVQQHRRQMADLFWRIRCVGSGSIPAKVQPLIWRAVKSQAVADAIDVLSAVPLAADPVERCLSPGPLVAVAETLRGIVAEADLQYRKAKAAALNASSADFASDSTRLRVELSGRRGAVSPLDLSEADFDSFLDICSRTAPEVLQWCQEQQKSAFGFQSDSSGKALPLRVMSQMLQRLENAGLLQKGQTAEFENGQNALHMQLKQPQHPTPSKAACDARLL